MSFNPSKGIANHEIIKEITKENRLIIYKQILALLGEVAKEIFDIEPTINHFAGNSSLVTLKGIRFFFGLIIRQDAKGYDLAMTLNADDNEETEKENCKIFSKLAFPLAHKLYDAGFIGLPPLIPCEETDTIPLTDDEINKSLDFVLTLFESEERDKKEFKEVSILCDLVKKYPSQAKVHKGVMDKLKEYSENRYTEGRVGEVLKVLEDI